ncbi:50S ribosomal protein L11 [Phytophthora cinnamomi]|uniref:50S ribosomal protein L11 n=1 Tax=Phytophthora cinnamomi TaxID=4785 RepID=UPI00355A9001|nr:50S ribosomal protein L11 [Phytophthora cinnamomi]
MSWLQTHEVAVPFYEVRAGKQVFAIQLHERALRQEELARNWSSITSTSSQFLLENDDDDENHSMAGNTSGVRVTAKRSYSQFRKLWRDLIRATKTPATAMLLRSNSAETTHSGHASNRSLANTFHSVPSSGGESSSCRCRNWNCTFRSFHHFLRSYPFPSKFLIKRNTPAVLENRRRGLELFITTVRGLFDTFPRPFLQSIDSLANCQVLMTLNIFFGFEEKYQLASRTTLRLPTVPKPTSTSRSSSSGSVASDSTTSFSSSSRSVTSSSSTWNIDKERRSIVALLLTHGADTNVTDSSGVSPLLSAVQRGDLEVVEMLVEYGANVNLCNTDNVSAVHVAVACQALPVLQLLLEFDAFVNTKNTYNGKTPLHLAAQSGSLPMCKLLLSHGGSIHHKTTRGLDVVALARSHGHDSVARLCLNFGNDQKMAQRESSKMSQTAAGASTSENLHDEVRIVSEDGYAYAVL